MKRALAVLMVVCLLPLGAAAQEQQAYPVLGPGARGDEVARLQGRLAELGLLTGKADGIYGQKTAAAVRAAQRHLAAQGHQLAPDGVAGPQTLALVYDDLAMRAFLDLKKGDSGSKVAALQTQLYDLNLLADRPDGVFGPRTEEALRRLQAALEAHGAPGAAVNGVADKATRDALAGDLSGMGIAAPAFFDDSDPRALTDDYLYARSAIVLDALSGQVLFEKDPDARRYPASTTKIMTLLVALEKGGLDRVVTVPQAAADVPKDSSLVPVYPGEKMTLRDLLYGLMIRSGNDAANAVAHIVSGSVPRFVEEMNRKAAQLGMKDTHFTNPHGYHNKEHYTTARDLAALTRFAMRSNAFLSIAGSQEYTLPKTSRREALVITGSAEILQPLSPCYYPGAYGFKSGYTRAAGFCYAGAAGKDGRQLLAVVMDCRTRRMAWDDMKRLFNYGFSQ